ncbi:MAG TPA: DNA-processing protein DprA [Bacillota bacterium]
MDPDDLERWCAAACAALEGPGPRRLQRLRDRFGSWQALWSAGPAAWDLEGVRPEQRATWQARYRADTPRRLREACLRLGITVLVRGDAAYPEALRQIPAPPTVLYARGDPALLAGTAVTIVGTRRATPYGRRVAADLAAAVAEAGGVVVSGMAMGIDACAHEGALRSGGATIAVLAAGVERPVPRSNRHLYERIVEHGAIVSEYPPGTTPERGRFHGRNRLMAALSRATVVVEAPLKSGALITAERALELDRTVLAVPAALDAEASRGCLSLLRDPAVGCVTEAADVLRAAGIEPAAPGAAGSGPGPLSLTGLESVVYALLGVGRPVSVETIIRQSGLPPARAVIALTALELRGLCIRQGGSAWRVEAGTKDSPRQRV